MANKYTAFCFVSNTHKQCSDCKEIKEHKDFYRDKKNIHGKGLSYYCKPCACTRARKVHKERYKKDPLYREEKRNNYIKSRYGLTLSEYAEKLKVQGNICTICGVELLTSGGLTHLDHDHTTGKIRDFLCTNCNRGLGHFKESTKSLLNAIKYLETHNSSVDRIEEVNINDNPH